MGTSCVFGSGTQSRVGARDVMVLSLAHIDSAMNRTDKSSLMRKLEKNLKSGIFDKQNINVCLIDFIYFLLLLPPQMPATFGEVATFIIKHACLHADTIHIICDT